MPLSYSPRKINNQEMRGKNALRQQDEQVPPVGPTKTAGGTRDPRKTAVLPYLPEATEEGWWDSSKAERTALSHRARTDRIMEAMTLI